MSRSSERDQNASEHKASAGSIVARANRLRMKNETFCRRQEFPGRLTPIRHTTPTAANGSIWCLFALDCQNGPLFLVFSGYGRNWEDRGEGGG